MINHMYETSNNSRPLGYYDRKTDRPTNQPTDVHKGSLPIRKLREQ